MANGKKQKPARGRKPVKTVRGKSLKKAVKSSAKSSVKRGLKSVAKTARKTTSAAKNVVKNAVGRGGKVARKAAVAVVKTNGNGLPKPSTKPWGQAGKALDGVKILDFTHV